MKRSLRSSCLIAHLTALVFTSSASAVDITYVVEHVALSDGYAVDSGFIKTNGTMGSLAPTDILDYEFVVTGPSIPYTFTPSNPVASIGITGDVIASSTDIVLSKDTDPFDGFPVQLSINANDSTAPECTSCSQNLTCFAGSTFDETEVFYLFSDTVPPPSVSGRLRIVPQHVFTIASVVPEPSTLVLATIGLVGIGCRGRKRT